MNMTLEEVKLYHYRLWDEIAKKIAYNEHFGVSLYIIKRDALEALQCQELVPYEYPENECYLCEYYNHCIDCPLNGCKLYFALIKELNKLEKKDIDKAIELAETIRDIYKKEV